MKVLYIGNKLSQYGINKTTVETLGEDLKLEGYNVIAVSNKKNFLLRILHMTWTTLTCSKANFILIDTYSTNAFWFAFICSQIARIRKIKYIPILHGGNLPQRLYKNPFLTQLIFKNAYKNVAPSNYLKYEFERVGYSNVSFIPNSIEIKKYNFILREDITPKLLWVRAFATIYNPLMAIEVFKKIKGVYPEATLTMVGPDKDGSLHACKQKSSELGLKVNFTGRLAKEEWRNLSETKDIFINTTHFDNTPVSVMEAMALGLPVVSTNVGGIPFLVEDEVNGLLVQDGDSDAMVNKIDLLLKNPELTSKLSRNGREMAESWDWKTVKGFWQKLLQ